MKNEAITILSGVVAGGLSKGLVSLAVKEESTPTTKGIVNLALCGAAGYGAYKVQGTDMKASVLRGAAVGVSIAQGLEAVKNFFSSETLNAKVASNTFLSKSLGLSAPAPAAHMLNGYIDLEGNYREEGLNGYIDINGNYVEDGLNGYYDEDGNYIDEDEEALNGLMYDDDENEDGLSAYVVDEYGNILI